MSKQGENNKLWKKSIPRLTQGAQERGIYGCEIRLPGCTGRLYCGFAHEHKRIWYINRPDLLVCWCQILVACSNCHAKIEPNRVLTKEIFEKLRPRLSLVCDHKPILMVA